MVVALEKTVSLLRESESSLYATLSVEELISQIEDELKKGRKSQPLDLKRLKSLYGPTCSLQGTAIDNGWGNEFLELAKVID